MKSLIAVSQVIVEAALSRDDSRGAHFREDFPATGELASSTFSVVRQREGTLDLTRVPVQFSRVRPGQTLLRDEEPNVLVAH
jgi:fumarate reductase flavoprotein subunit